MSAHPSYNDSELHARIAQGDHTAFRQLYDMYAQRVFRAAMLYANDVHLAEDVVQHVFGVCWEKRARFAEVESTGDYLFIIARNRIFDELKKIAGQQRLADQYLKLHNIQEPSLDDELLVKQYRQVLKDAVEQLPEQQRMAYRLYEQGTTTYEEIAERMQLSRLTVKKHLELARRSVRQYLKQHLPDDLALAFYCLIAFGLS